MTAIERRQMWCKLAVLIADGMPAPRDINFYEPFTSFDGQIVRMLEIVVDDAAALWRWADTVGGVLGEPSWSEHNSRWRQSAEARDWLGYVVTVKTYNASALGADVGMATVRAVAAKSIPGEGEEVAGPVVGAGSATAPTEPDVWVARRRDGIHFHALDGSIAGSTAGSYTNCGRAARVNGHRIAQSEAESFGAAPCPRCYAESEG